jgi:5-methylcytosine-specific restriction endonuclease McrA
MSFKGRKFTIEHREKLRQAKINKPLVRTELGKKSFSEKMSGEKHPQYIGKATLVCLECSNSYQVKPYRKDSAKFCSRLCKNRNSNHGLTSMNEKIRKSNVYRIWRDSVFARDKYTCQKCGVKNGNGKSIYFHADHIKPFALYPKERLNVSNGRTLCVDCHKKTGTYGRVAMYRKPLLALLNNF